MAFIAEYEYEYDYEYEIYSRKGEGPQKITPERDIIPGFCFAFFEVYGT